MVFSKIGLATYHTSVLFNQLIENFDHAVLAEVFEDGSLLTDLADDLARLTNGLSIIAETAKEYLEADL
jgi:hypothetical protein